MKRNKRILAAMLSMVMILLLAACGGDSSSAAPSAGDSPAAPIESSETAAEESAWPEGSVTLYIPAKAGGTTDGLARMLAENWGAYTGQSFVVVNDTTGNGTVASETVRNADTSGLELMLYNTSWCSMIAVGQYDKGFDDFTVLGAISDAGPESTCILVNANSPLQTMDDLVTYAQAHPGELNCGGQVNSRGQFVEILVEDALDFSTTLVDSGSNADTITALLGENIDLCCITTTSAAPYVESGDLRALAVNGENKSVLMPDVPLLTDLGHEAIDLPMVHFLLGPKNMSGADINAVSAMLKQSIEDATLMENTQKAGVYLFYKDPAESIEYLNGIQEDFNKAADIIANLS